MERVQEFQREYRFLSNFYAANVVYKEIEFPTVEHAYQAAKYEQYQNSEDKMAEISSLLTPGMAKRAGQEAIVPIDWDIRKFDVMEELVRQKFTRHLTLQNQLLATGDMTLEEGNDWGDIVWGVELTTGKGENRLGKILMKVRAELFKQSRDI